MSIQLLGEHWRLVEPSNVQAMQACWEAVQRIAAKRGSENLASTLQHRSVAGHFSAPTPIHNLFWIFVRCPTKNLSVSSLCSQPIISISAAIPSCALLTFAAKLVRAAAWMSLNVDMSCLQWVALSCFFHAYSFEHIYLLKCDLRCQDRKSVV